MIVLFSACVHVFLGSYSDQGTECVHLFHYGDKIKKKSKRDTYTNVTRNYVPTFDGTDLKCSRSRRGGTKKKKSRLTSRNCNSWRHIKMHLCWSSIN